MTEFSIIIPFQKPTPYLTQTLDELERQTGQKFEVLLLPDEEESPQAFGNRPYPLKVIPTGPVSPAIKRDIGADAAKGEFLSFIDDDAYPALNWLDSVKRAFSHDDIAAVAGPQLTPEEDGFWQQVSGAVFLSSLNGMAVYRYWPAPHAHDVDDWPSVNLCVRKKDFAAAGKFDSTYWPGEDTKLCLDLTHKLGKRIRYTPHAIVRHHRRSGLKKHLRQVGGYGLHRGYFARKFPQTSSRFQYFVPTLFAMFALLGWLFLFLGDLAASIYHGAWTIYAAGLLVALGSIQARSNSWAVALCALPYIVITHLWYGLQFFRGFFVADINRHGLGR